MTAKRRDFVDAALVDAAFRPLPQALPTAAARLWNCALPLGLITILLVEVSNGQV
jgi:hypothetical protein